MTLPKENLDNKTFDELVKDAVSRIPVHTPLWTDHNIHDPGRTFIELFAWLTEMQIYSLNRITDRSKRKFLKLMGIPKLEPAKAAEADLTFSLKQGVSPMLVLAGTMVIAGEPGKDVFFETTQDLNVIDARLIKIFAHPKGMEFNDNTDANRNENVYYYAFSARPWTGDELYIGFDKSLAGEIILAFYLFEEKSIKEEKMPYITSAGRLIWEYFAGGGWKTADVEDGTGDLTISGKIKIKMEDATGHTEINNADLFWLRCRVTEIEYEIPPRIDTIRLNTVPAVARIAVKNKTFSSSGLPDFYMGLKEVPVLDGTLDVKVNNEPWMEVEDFDASRPGDKHYRMDPVNSRVIFGNGINGRIPPEGSNNITVSYYSGGGTSGNVKSHTISKILDAQIVDKVTVDNMKAASGGKDPETLEDAIYRSRKSLKQVTRAVTSLDYEELARNTPGLAVARAKAIPRYHPSQHSEVPGIVSVIVVPRSPYPKPVPSPGFLRTVYMYLEEQRLLTTELFVIPPDYIEVCVDATVKIKQKSVPERVKSDVQEKLESYLDPIRGGADGNGWQFGRSVYLSEIYHIIDGVDGVDYVMAVTFKKNGIEQAGDIDIPEHSLVYPGYCMITAEE